MSSNKNFTNDEIKKIHSILKELREATETDAEKAISQRELAIKMRKKGVTISHSRISKLENADDDTEPSLSDLLAYRDYFHVSIDYLLGLEKEPTLDVDLKTISKEFGISSEAMKNIKKVNSRVISRLPSDRNIALNRLLESRGFSYFIDSFYDYLMFYPSVKDGALVFSYDGTVDENCDFVFDHSEFIEGDSDLIDDLLLDRVKNNLKKIKHNSPEFIIDSKKELDALKKQYSEWSKAKSDEFSGGETGRQLALDDCKNKINRIEQKLTKLNRIKKIR